MRVGYNESSRRCSGNFGGVSRHSIFRDRIGNRFSGIVHRQTRECMVPVVFCAEGCILRFFTVRQQPHRNAFRLYAVLIVTVDPVLGYGYFCCRRYMRVGHGKSIRCRSGNRSGISGYRVFPDGINNLFPFIVLSFQPGEGVCPVVGRGQRHCPVCHISSVSQQLYGH